MSAPLTDPPSANGSAASHEMLDDATGAIAGVSELARTRPEVLVGAAFAGGLALAIFVRRLVRSA